MQVPGSIPPYPRNPLARRTLLQVALYISAVIVVTTGIGYLHFFGTFESQALNQIRDHLRERADRESAVFLIAERNLAMIGAEFLRRLAQEESADPGPAFDRLFMRSADGLIRIRPELDDPLHKATVHIRHDGPVDADLQRRVLLFYELLNAYGPAYRNQVVSTYFGAPEALSAAFNPDGSGGREAPRDAVTRRSGPATNPAREPFWTGVHYDEAARAWTVSRIVPIDHRGRWVALVGHDIDLTALLERTVNVALPGTFNVILREDGQVIAHPDRMDRIAAAGGDFRIDRDGDAVLRDMLRAARGAGPSPAVAESGDGSAFYGIARIEGPGWVFLTVLPKALIRSDAIAKAGFVLAMGGLALAIEMAILWRVLRRQVAQPLRRLTEAIERVAAGRLSIRLNDLRRDELGRLAGAFNSMTASLADSERRLVRKIHEQAALVRDYERAKEEAEVATRSKSEFLANITHELRTPLNAIIGFAELLMTADPSDPAQRSAGPDQAEFACIIHQNGHHLLSLINDILDVSKLDAGRGELAEERVDPGGAVRSAVALIAPRAEEKRIAITCHVVAGLPPLLADERRVKQMLHALLSNAVKFTAEGGRITVTAARSTLDGGLEIAIADTGIGMDADQIDRALEPFGWGEGGFARLQQGFGLGLPLTRRLIELHQGRLDIRSGAGEGTTVTLHFPPARVLAGAAAFGRAAASSAGVAMRAES